jgi:DNA-binding NarL/FixJ family response regulator
MRTIFLAEGQKHVRDALRLMFEHQSDFEIIGEASSAESTLAQVCRKPPDAILLDWGLPGIHPQRLLAALRQCAPTTLILVTSVRQEAETVARQFGVDAFLLKLLPPDQFMADFISALDQITPRKSETK